MTEGVDWNLQACRKGGAAGRWLASSAMAGRDPEVKNTEGNKASQGKSQED